MISWIEQKLHPFVTKVLACMSGLKVILQLWTCMHRTIDEQIAFKHVERFQ